MDEAASWPFGICQPWGQVVLKVPVPDKVSLMPRVDNGDSCKALRKRLSTAGGVNGAVRGLWVSLRR